MAKRKTVRPEGLSKKQLLKLLTQKRIEAKTAQGVSDGAK